LSIVGSRCFLPRALQQTPKAQIHLPGEGAELKLAHEVYIYACKDVAIFIDAKCKGVKMYRCRNVTLILDSVLSGVEVVNCKKVKVQANKNLPSVAIDKTDGIVVGLVWEARGAQIVTSKSSEMNVTFPVSADPEAEWKELPIPEQFLAKVMADNTLYTTVSELYS